MRLQNCRIPVCSYENRMVFGPYAYYWGYGSYSRFMDRQVTGREFLFPRCRLTKMSFRLRTPRLCGCYQFSRYYVGLVTYNAGFGQIYGVVHGDIK